jgi:hypothetical protein
VLTLTITSDEDDHDDDDKDAARRKDDPSPIRQNAVLNSDKFLFIRTKQHLYLELDLGRAS